ncbi:MAG: cytochrome c oxidase assembly protein [Vulcanimicrobiaceae bacterium]
MDGLFHGWRFDPAVVLAAALAIAAYGAGVARFGVVRNRRWARTRSWWFAAGVIAGFLAIESPLDAAGDLRFSPHMVQHLILTDVTAPCLLLGAPLLLVLSVAPNRVARSIVAFLKGPVGRVLTFPVFTWTVFILSLWLIHFSGFFELALEHEPVHILEHAIFVGTALLFWFPVIAIGPTPWSHGPLAFPLRMFYLMLAMPAEGMLGFAINGARHGLYPHYAAAGLSDQQSAGEIMWVGGTLAMFVAFMIVGYHWAEHEQRLDERPASPRQ